MAVENHYRSLPGVTASADFSTTGQCRFVKLDGACTVGLAGAGEAVDGVLMNCPALGKAATVAGVGDLAKVQAAAAIPAGSFVASDATGQAIVATSGDYIAGRVLDGVAAAGEVVSVYLTMPGRLA